jgi:hypothetical protein
MGVRSNLMPFKGQCPSMLWWRGLRRRMDCSICCIVSVMCVPATLYEHAMCDTTPMCLLLLLRACAAAGHQHCCANWLLSCQ